MRLAQAVEEKLRAAELERDQERRIREELETQLATAREHLGHPAADEDPQAAEAQRKARSKHAPLFLCRYPSLSYCLMRPVERV